MVYVLLVDGFEEIEAITPIDILRRCDVEVRTVGVDTSKVTGAHGITVETDILIDKVNPEAMRVLLLPGGPGHIHLEESEKVRQLISYAAENNKYIAAICAAPSILGKMGLLEGKKAICFPGYEQYLHGAEVIDRKAVTDKNIITAKGAGAASDFGFMIASHLVGQEVSDKIKAAMQY